jgi:SOUL heme-binding protein
MIAAYRLLRHGRMFTFVDDSTANVGGPLPSAVGGLPSPTTEARGWRKLAWLASLLAVPATAGLHYARGITRSRLLGGGFTALAIGALRVELGRWLTPELAFEPAGQIGSLELRRYHTRIEAWTQVDDPGLESALDHGYSRLASYICGANRSGGLIDRTMPILTEMRDGQYAVSFAMPPGRALDELPQPEHPSVALRRIPAHEIAALRFRGPITDDNVAAHECVLLQQLVDAGLSARGSIAFATFDSPATWPILRRNELWIEVV